MSAGRPDARSTSRSTCAPAAGSTAPSGRGWRELLPAAGRAIVRRRPRSSCRRSPTRSTSSTPLRPGAPEAWIELMRPARAWCREPDQLLRGRAGGGVAQRAWPRTGPGPWTSAASLPPVRRAGMPSSRSPAGPAGPPPADPWFDPPSATATAATPTTAIVRVGAFRGFGGTFRRPPRVTLVAATWSPATATSGGTCSPTPSARRCSGPPPPTRPPPRPRWPRPSEPAPAALAGIPELTSWVEGPTGFVATSDLSPRRAVRPGGRAVTAASRCDLDRSATSGAARWPEALAPVEPVHPPAAAACAA